MTSSRMQHPCDPFPTRTRQSACGEGAPAEHDEHIRNRPMALRLGFIKEHSDVYKRRTVQTI